MSCFCYIHFDGEQHERGEEGEAAAPDAIGEEEFPYLSCLIDPEILDWRQGLSDEEIKN